jgi:hypothetical protein
VVTCVNKLLDIVYLASEGRREMSDPIGNAVSDRVFCGYPQTGIFQFTPPLDGHCYAIPQNTLGANIVENDTFCYRAQWIGACRLNPSCRPMQHDRCLCTSLAFASAEIGDCGNREGWSGCEERIGWRSPRRSLMTLFQNANCCDPVYPGLARGERIDERRICDRLSRLPILGTIGRNQREQIEETP